MWYQIQLLLRRLNLTPTTALAILAVVLGVATLYWFSQPKQSGGSATRAQPADETPTLFYASYCKACKALMPLAKRLAKQGRLNLVDGEAQAELASQYNIQYWPTIVQAQGGQLSLVEKYDSCRQFLENLEGANGDSHSDALSSTASSQL